MSAALALVPRSVAFSAARLARRVDELAGALAAEYAGDEPLLVALDGGERLAAELCARLGWPPAERLTLAPFAPGGRVRVLRDVQQPLAGRTVLVVEGVVDTGLTLRAALGALAAHAPASLEACVLLDRPHRRLVDELPIQRAAFRAPDRLLVGYGIAHLGRWAELPDVRALEVRRAPDAAA